MQNISLASYLQKYKKPVLLSGLAHVAYSVFTLVSIPLLIPFFQLLFGIKSSNDRGDSAIERWVGHIFSSIIESSGPQKALIIVCIAFVLSIALRNMFRYLALYIIAPARNGVVADLREKIYHKIFQLPYHYFTESQKGDLISKSIADVQEIDWSIISTIESIFRLPILLVGALSLMLMISAKMTLWVILLIIIVLFVIRVVAKNLRKASFGGQESLGRLTSIIEETISGARMIKGFNAEKYQHQRFDKENKTYYTISNKTLRTRDLSSPISETLGMVIVGIIMYLGANEVFAIRLAPEAFFAFLLAFYQVIEPAKSLTSSYFNIQKGMAAIDRINQLMEVEDKLIDHNENITWAGFHDTIYFKDIGHSYNEGDAVLSNITFEIKKGEKVALVGQSGSGKTTLAHLLCRTFDPSQGTITIDEMPLNLIPLQIWRKHVSLVSQDHILFHDSIKNNITLGSPLFTDEQVWYALERASAKEFVQDSQYGLHTPIGDGGIKISGGQKQRLSIARALLHDAQILVLDEATSALDTQTEKNVQSAIDDIGNNVTIIVIAHRLSTIINADKIILLQNGKIVGIGTHHKLLQENTYYQELINQQVI